MTFFTGLPPLYARNDSNEKNEPVTKTNYYYLPPAKFPMK